MPKVLFAASEATPIAKVGGLGDVAGALPKALRSQGVDIRVVIPRYHGIDTPGRLPGSQVPIDYIASSQYFDREQIYGYDDDKERFSYFSEQTLEFARKERFEPDIVHANDYHTSLIPELLKTKYRRDSFFAQTKSVLTIHNLANQGGDLLRRGIVAADALVAVSPTYAQEILTPEFGEGLEGVLKEHQGKLRGILNGIDTDSYDPATDPNLPANYSVEKLSDRATDKAGLVREFKLSNPSWPLFGLVTRLVEQKGIDLVLEVGLDKMPLNLVVLGTGDEKYQDQLAALADRSSNIRVKLEFNEGLARRIYGGSDFFLVPSHFEPSGLTQMIAMRYGSIPVVRRTGGLADTVFEGRNGVVFEHYRPEELRSAVERALEIYRDGEELADLQRRGMNSDFSWQRSAREYVKLYQEVLKLPKSYET